MINEREGIMERGQTKRERGREWDIVGDDISGIVSKCDRFLTFVKSGE